MLCHAALAALLLRYAYPRIDAARRRALMGWWSAKLLRILNVEARVSGAMPAQSAVMIAANHVSWLDIFLIASARPTRFIAKGEVRDWPLAGWIADKAGTLFIRREQWRDTARINARVHEALAERDCVGLFPEGFTTEGDTLLKFHAALFAPAIANNALVQPAAIRYERPDGALCREASFIGERSFMESLGLIIGERRIIARLMLAAPLCTQGAHRRDVSRECEKRVATLLGLEPSGTPPRRSADPPAAPR
jgi:1-acyl-sn-glycerol-3-phosphate acyltransferase